MNIVFKLLCICSCLVFSSCAYYSSIEADAIDAVEEEFRDDFWGTKAKDVKVVYSTDQLCILDFYTEGLYYRDNQYYIYAKSKNGAFGRSGSFFSKGNPFENEFQRVSDQDSISIFLQNTYDEALNRGRECESPMSSRKTIWFLSEAVIALLMGIILLIVYLAKKDKEDKKDLEIVKKYEDYMISDNVYNSIETFAMRVLKILPYTLWLTYYYGRGMDFCFYFLLPFFFLYVYHYYDTRRRYDNEEVNKESIKEESEKSSIHDSYKVKLQGKKSYNPILFILDYLFQWFPGEKNTLFLTIAIPAAFICPLPITLGIVNGTHISIYTYVISILLLFILICAILKIDKLYRRLRHKYFKKHNLPGPYGWGTLDYTRYNSNMGIGENYSGGSNGGYRGGYGHGAGYVSSHYRSGHYRNGHWVSGHWVSSHWRN